MFFFHTKMPKCGSTTMKSLLTALSYENDFNFQAIEATKSNSNSDTESDLLSYLDDMPDSVYFDDHKIMKKPLIIIKHHTFVNFTKYFRQQPTYLNVVRHFTVR